MADGERQQDPRLACQAHDLLHEQDGEQRAEAARVCDDGGISGVPHEEGHAQPAHGGRARNARPLEPGRERLGPQRERRGALHVHGEHERYRHARRNARCPLAARHATVAHLPVARLLHIVACGSAYHAGVTGKYVLEGLARIPVEVDLASEFRYRNPILEDGAMVVVISQSGETADTLAALRESKKRGFKVLGIVNVVGSSIARESDNVMYTWAGPEIAVATTKAYSAQLIALYLLAMKFARVKHTVTETEFSDMLGDLARLPDQIELLLNNKNRIQRFANRYIAAKDVFFIGRGIDYAISMEGSLKLKEISYIHSEAYAAGELKHGTISLIEEGTLVASVSTQPALYKKTISNMVEVKSRGAFVLAVTCEGNREIEKASDYVIYIPQTNPFFTNSLAIIPLQLFSYYVAVGKGCDVDKPRNLAKSVTVE